MFPFIIFLPTLISVCVSKKEKKKDKTEKDVEKETEGGRNLTEPLMGER